MWLRCSASSIYFIFCYKLIYKEIYKNNNISSSFSILDRIQHQVNNITMIQFNTSGISV